MKVFVAAVTIAILCAVLAAFVLDDFVQVTAEQAYHTASARP